jgi:hypothetical protein
MYTSPELMLLSILARMESPSKCPQLEDVGSTLFTGNAAVDVETYGRDPDGPIPESDDDTVMVSVPDTNIPLSQSSLDTLHTTIVPL